MGWPHMHSHRIMWRSAGIEGLIWSVWGGLSIFGRGETLWRENCMGFIPCDFQSIRNVLFSILDFLNNMKAGFYFVMSFSFNCFLEVFHHLLKFYKRSSNATFLPTLFAKVSISLPDHMIIFRPFANRSSPLSLSIILRRLSQRGWISQRFTPFSKAYLPYLSPVQTYVH